MKVLAPAFVLLVALALVPISASAQTASSDVFTYKLEKDSRFDIGCFGLCECAVVTHPIQGTFFLQHTGFDPLYDYYAINDVRWVVSDANVYAEIRGSGTYKRGGEFALTHQLVLDLSVNGEPPKRFDSGMIVGGSQWPQIVIDISLHQNQACRDTLIHVDATDPLTTGVDISDPSRAPVLRVAPNPFRHAIDFGLALPRSGNTTVLIYDAGGRAVRHLRSEWLSTGVHPMSWDGRRDKGDECPAGVYFVSAQVGPTRVTTRIVKVN